MFNFFKNKIMKFFPLIFLCLVGCTMPAQKGDFQLPRSSEFPAQELSYKIYGDKNSIIDFIQIFLANRGIPSIVERRDSKFWIITTFLPEKSAKDERRIRKTAFRLEIVENPLLLNEKCSEVRISTITKSKGIHEELWQVTESEVEYPPFLIWEIRSLLQKRSCR